MFKPSVSTEGFLLLQIFSSLAFETVGNGFKPKEFLEIFFSSGISPYICTPH